MEKIIEKNLGAYALFVKGRKLQLQQTTGTDPDGNAILKTTTFNMWVEADLDEDELDDVITFANCVATITDKTVNAVYQNVTKQVQESVGE